ncbi:hypothetical protein FSB73_00035 [Arachidicoccus ginsenosidivorans]|uniref:Uncharacterized protein n=1 Tax=Arachidicoccus ginsenosidivorans TaxID=496057 RepID=A0A5B8VGQ9_9BACT|nr:hypothetical protein [Arachidicoccus ginsenosidivorans]QEC70343.1 hypothetical protein FSB73_00035 [Arachidicoccus ginsenosidivorans]
MDFAKESELAAIGWKWWAGVNKKSGSTAARMLGVVDVKETGQHKIRFELVSGANADCNFDMVQFIPVDWPVRLALGSTLMDPSNIKFSCFQFFKLLITIE